RETALARIATEDQVVIAQVQADCLQSQLILIGPEPGNRIVVCGLARDESSHDHRLVRCILHRFQADELAVRVGIDVLRAVADRKYIREAGTAVRVHFNSVCHARAWARTSISGSIPIPTITRTAGSTCDELRRTPVTRLSRCSIACTVVLT